MIAYARNGRRGASSDRWGLKAETGYSLAPHSWDWRASAAWTSAAVHDCWRHVRACCWKLVLVQTQVMSVLCVRKKGENVISIAFAEEGT